MLALSTGEAHWAKSFREVMLTEAQAAEFTEPANSVNYGQRLVAQQVFSFSRVREAFPDLYSGLELAI